MEKNDYELVYLTQSGNEDAVTELYRRYKPMIIKKSNQAILKADHHGFDINDIMQECYIAFDEAIKSFSQDGDASFNTFVNLCVNRRLVNFLRKAKNNKESVLNNSITLNETLEKVLSDDVDLEKNLTMEDTEKEIIKFVLEELTDFEKSVFELKVKNYTVEEISKLLEKDAKSIYNTIQRIKAKIKKIIERDN